MELMIQHKVNFERLLFALFLISMPAGAFWEYGLRGATRFPAPQNLQATSRGTLSVTDLSPRFLAFCEQAVKEKAIQGTLAGNCGRRCITSPRFRRHLKATKWHAISSTELGTVTLQSSNKFA